MNRRKTSMFIMVAVVGMLPTASCWMTTKTPFPLSARQTTTATTITTTSTTRFMSSTDGTNSNAKIDPQEYLERARKLREEIEAFENKKDKLEEAEQKATRAELDKKQSYIDSYSVVIPILKPDASVLEESIFFPPTKHDGDNVVNSQILVFEIPLPMGILLGQEEEGGQSIVVDEVAPGTNGEAAGVQEGDILRACTACRMEMSQPTWQLIAGGIGQPKTFRFMYGTDGETLEQTMEAIGSNRMDPQGRPALLVLERPNKK